MSLTSMASRSISLYCDGPLTSTNTMKGTVSSLFSSPVGMKVMSKAVNSRASVVCSAAPESSTATVAETKKAPKVENEAPKSEAPPAKPKRTPPAKAPAKPLPELMEEDVIPSLRAILEAQEDLSQIELSYQDNRLEGSFLKNGKPYGFWAFFPNGVLTGPRGFSLSSYGSGASTIEPFLIDEKKITAKHVVFWVEKRLAAQDILPLVNA